MSSTYMNFRKIPDPAPVKIKLACPPPNQKYPLPCNEHFMGMEVFLQKEPKKPRRL